MNNKSALLAAIAPREEIIEVEGIKVKVRELESAAQSERLRDPGDATYAAMVARGDGRIVLVSSVAARQGGLLAGAEYSASKGALVSLGRHIARNGAAHGVRCNMSQSSRFYRWVVIYRSYFGRDA